MTAKQELKKRHQLAIDELKKVALPKIEKEGVKPVCEKISATIGVSYQTIANYVYGMAKDGFLTEQITKEFKKI
jgi:predicted transcriptional regulator